MKVTLLDLQDSEKDAVRAKVYIMNILSNICIRWSKLDLHILELMR